MDRTASRGEINHRIKVGPKAALMAKVQPKLAVIPSHLSALPCGSCKEPTSTLTLRRIENIFLCPCCHARTAMERRTRPPVEPVETSARKLLRLFDHTRKAIKLSILALFVTGFVVLPSLFDPNATTDYRGRRMQLTNTPAQAIEAHHAG